MPESTSTNPRALLNAINALPDSAIVTKPEAAALTGVSIDTLWRLHQRGEGPRRLQLSERRVGYRIADLKFWLDERGK